MIGGHELSAAGIREHSEAISPGLPTTPTPSTLTDLSEQVEIGATYTNSPPPPNAGASVQGQIGLRSIAGPSPTRPAQTPCMYQVY